MFPLRRDFDQLWHGYDRNQVRQYIDYVEAQLHQVIVDRDAAQTQAETLARELENVRSEVDKLRRRVDELNKPPESMEDLDGRMQRTINLANERAEEITTRAQVAAEEHWQATVEASTKLRERYTTLLSELDSHAQALHREHEAALETTKAEVAELTSESARRREELDGEAERKRRTVEREFDATMESERQALDKHMADQRTAAKNQAERRIAEANAEAKRLLDEAKAEATHRVQRAQAEADRITNETNTRSQRLTHIHRDAHKGLSGAEEILAGGASALRPLDGEQEELDREWRRDGDDAVGEHNGDSSHGLQTSARNGQ